MVVEFTTTCGIVAYHHVSCELKLHSWRGVLDKTLCDKVCQWLDKTVSDKVCQWLDKTVCDKVCQWLDKTVCDKVCQWLDKTLCDKVCQWLDKTLCDKVCQWLDKTVCDKVCQWLATGLWISLGTPISATKVVTEIFLKVMLTNLQWTNDGSKVCVCSA
jgi:hypothetical protein